MSAVYTLSVLSLLLAAATGAPQERQSPARESTAFLSLAGARQDGGDSSGGGGGRYGGFGGFGGGYRGFGGGGSLDLNLPSPPRTASRPLIPLSGPAGSAAAAAGLAGSAAHGNRGISGGLKGVGIRVLQTDRVSLGAGFSTNFKGDNAGGLHLTIDI